MAFAGVCRVMVGIQGKKYSCLRALNSDAKVPMDSDESDDDDGDPGGEEFG